MRKSDYQRLQQLPRADLERLVWRSIGELRRLRDRDHGSDFLYGTVLGVLIGVAMGWTAALMGSGIF